MHVEPTRRLPRRRQAANDDDRRLLWTCGGFARRPLDSFGSGVPSFAEILELRDGRVFWKALGSDVGMETLGERPEEGGGIGYGYLPGSDEPGGATPGNIGERGVLMTRARIFTQC